jgi:hypothetical protein
MPYLASRKPASASTVSSTRGQRAASMRPTSGTLPDGNVFMKD